MKTYEFGGGKYQVICNYQKTRSGFKHTAVIRDELSGLLAALGKLQAAIEAIVSFVS